MPYVKTTWVNDETLINASRLNNMENGIEAADAQATTNATDIGNLQDSIAEEFSTSKSYAVGDYVMHEGSLYIFTSAHAAGAWSSGDVSEAVLGEDVESLKSQINEFSGNIADTATVVSGFYIGTNGKIGVLTVSESDRMICIAAKPNTKYTVKKATATIMRAAVYSSTTVENLTQLVNYTAHSTASSDPLYIETDSTNTYIYIQLFAGSDAAELRTIEANTASLVVTDLDISQISKDFYKYANNRYIIYPTGDTTNRRLEVEAALANHKEVYFAPGDYYFNATVTLPSNTRICGAGKTSKLIMASTATGQFIQCGNDCQISSLWIDGGLSAKPSDAITNRHGIRVQDNAQTLQMHDCWITGFGGSGVRVSNAGYRDLSSVQITNCYFQYNGNGVLFSEHGEYGVISNSVFLDNYMGVYVLGGNNIIDGCTLERNTVGALVYGNNVDNSGHGAFIGCSFNHNTDIGVQINRTDNGYLVSGCQMFRNENYDISVNASGVNVNGCQFGISPKLRFADTCVINIADNMFGSKPTTVYLTGCKVKSSNNHLMDGTEINLAIPIGPGNDVSVNDDTKLSDFGVVHGLIGGNGKWSDVGSANYDSIFVPIDSGTGVKIITKSGVTSYFGFLKNYSNPVDGASASLSTEPGYNVILLATSQVTRYFKAPVDVKYLYICTKSNGTDRTPESIVINGHDIVSGESVIKSIYAGSAGTLDTLMNRASKLICTIIDDDAQNVASMEKLYTECEANNVKCTIACLTDKWESQTGLEEKLHEMEEAGYHIVLHAHTQNGNNNWQDFESRVSDYTANFVTGLRNLHKSGFANCDFWVTPGGVQYAGCQALARKYGMKALIAGVNGINIANPQGSLPTSGSIMTRRDNSRWRIIRANLRPEDDQDWTLQNLKDLASYGVNLGSWLILCMHSYQWTDSDDHSARLAEFVAHAKSLGYEFMTLGEAWTYKEPLYRLYDMT